MRPRLMTAGIVGTVIAVICCFTPALVVVLGAIGLSAWGGWFDAVMLPGLAICIGLVVYAVLSRKRAARG